MELMEKWCEEGRRSLPEGFTLRAGYPNQRSLQQCRARRGLEPGTKVLAGYRAPIVRCRLSGEERPREFEVREVDLPMLLHEDEQQARTHLWLLLRSRQGDGEARQVLEQIQTEANETTNQYLCDRKSTEDDYLVPCTSEIQHREATISHKGTILLRLCQQGFSVPDFAIMTAKSYLLPPSEREELIVRVFETLEGFQLPTFGPRKQPLVIALRCAMPVYIPGIMYTFLNVGVTTETFDKVSDYYGSVPAQRMFLNNLGNYLMCHDPRLYRELVEELRLQRATDEIAETLQQVKELVLALDERFLHDARYQADYFIRQAYRYYDDNQDLLRTFACRSDHYPSVIFQRMVCTVRAPRSHVGVLHSRNPLAGKGMQLHLARDIFGEEIMTGLVEPEEVNFVEAEEIIDSFPGVHHFSALVPGLEQLFAGPATVEFAVEATERYELFALLQLNEANLSGRAAFLAIMDLYRRGLIDRQRAIELIRPYHFTQVESGTISEASLNTLRSFSQGVSILPRTAVSARAAFSTTKALEYKEEGEKVCLFKDRLLPTDTVILREMDAIICLTPAAIHAVTVCQGYGIPGLLSLGRFGNSFGRDEHGSPCFLNQAGERIHEGDWVTISSRRQLLYVGRAVYEQARLLRYLAGETVELNAEERTLYAALAKAYLDYHRLVEDLEPGAVASLNDLVRLVRTEFKHQPERQQQLVNERYERDPEHYLDEVLACEMGNHLNQQTVYLLLTPERRIDFFHRALRRCKECGLSGLAAGSFVLGRFVNQQHPVTFWQAMDEEEISRMLDEWVRFEQYMKVLHLVGEKEVGRVRQQLDGVSVVPLEINTARLRHFVPLKLAGKNLEIAAASLSEGANPQTRKVIELLLEPFGVFYRYDAAWSLGQLEELCRKEGVSMPSAEDC
ncbi:MAG: hypothetical protein A2284_17310 [Deltaproteobacteria bacterium RIFOXYA12_FULL_61_11]|nr:MAG: hypothetical protein A2284_17310 [Deltaproteobacteria bacterium RIFOXYA12_FULL_61_11]